MKFSMHANILYFIDHGFTFSFPKVDSILFILDRIGFSLNKIG